MKYEQEIKMNEVTYENVELRLKHLVLQSMQGDGKEPQTHQILTNYLMIKQLELINDSLDVVIEKLDDISMIDPHQ